MVPMLKTKVRLYRKCSFFRVIIVVWLAVLLWNEYLAFAVESWKWSTLVYSSHLSSQQAPIRVLFVADPQLIGLNDEHPKVGPISRWDSDRYLKKTFQQAYSYFAPDVVIFLGDLLDEGSNAKPEEYDSYMKRFKNTFNIPSNILTIYLPGDNDVGGEGFDAKEKHKIDAFNLHFLPDQTPPPDVINYHYLDFLRVDLAPYEMAADRIQRQFIAMRQLSKALYRLLCSHVSIIDRSFNDQNKIISLLGADLIFSAHTHKSTIYMCTDCGEDGPRARQFSLFQGQTIEVYDNRVYHLELTDKRQMYEIQVPTCSYRMGVPHMGYGAATIDVKGHVRYTVLWSPGRYPQLFLYIGLLITTAIACIIRVCYRRCPCVALYCDRYLLTIRVWSVHHIKPVIVTICAKCFNYRFSKQNFFTV